jgi:hypothetical protein
MLLGEEQRWELTIMYYCSTSEDLGKFLSVYFRIEGIGYGGQFNPFNKVDSEPQPNRSSRYPAPDLDTWHNMPFPRFYRQYLLTSKYQTCMQLSNLVTDHYGAYMYQCSLTDHELLYAVEIGRATSSRAEADLHVERRWRTVTNCAQPVFWLRTVVSMNTRS